MLYTTFCHVSENVFNDNVVKSWSMFSRWHWKYEFCLLVFTEMFRNFHFFLRLKNIISFVSYFGSFTKYFPGNESPTYRTSFVVFCPNNWVFTINLLRRTWWRKIKGEKIRWAWVWPHKTWPCCCIRLIFMFHSVCIKFIFPNKPGSHVELFLPEHAVLSRQFIHRVPWVKILQHTLLQLGWIFQKNTRRFSLSSKNWIFLRNWEKLLYQKNSFILAGSRWNELRTKHDILYEETSITSWKNWVTHSK